MTEPPSVTAEIELSDPRALLSVKGNGNQTLHALEEELGIELGSRGNVLRISGVADRVAFALTSSDSNVEFDIGPLGPLELSIGWLVGIAAAPDFTEDLIWARLTETQRERMRKDGRLLRPSDYAAEPDVLTLRLVEEGRGHLVLRAPIPIACPVRLPHGTADADVPWQRSLALLERLESRDARLLLIKNVDHRLSEPPQIEAMLAAVSELAAQ